MSRSTCASFVILLAVAADSPGQAPSPWVGQKVVAKPGVPLRVEGRTVDPGNRFRVYTVEQAKGPWLWLHSWRVEGWVPADQVVRFDDAIAEQTRDIAQHPDLIQGYTNRGVLWLSADNLDKALADFEEGLRRRPTSAVLHFHRGGVRFKKKDYKGAMADFDEAIQSGGSPSWEPYVARAHVWCATKEYAKAIADCDEALKRDPNNINALLTRADAWGSQDDDDRAITDYTEVLKHDPRNAQAYRWRGVAWEHKKDYRRAIADYNEALRITPRDAWVYYQRGDAWRYLKDYDKALADYNQSLALAPRDYSTYLHRGDVWMAQKSYDKALADFERARDLEPDALHAYHALARFWTACPDRKYRNTEKAIQAATRACELTAWKEHLELSLLATCYLQAENFDKAIEIQTKANQVAPNEAAREFGERRLQTATEAKKRQTEKAQP